MTNRHLTLLALTSVVAFADGCRSQSSAGPSRPAPVRVAPEGPFEGAPGGLAFDAGLSERLKRAWDARARDYVARTRHLRVDGSPKYVNRLFLES